MPATNPTAQTTDLTYAQYAEWIAAQLRAMGRSKARAWHGAGVHVVYMAGGSVRIDADFNRDGGNYGGALREYVRTGGRIDADRDIASLRSVNVAVASYDHITGTVTVDGAIDINALM